MAIWSTSVQPAFTNMQDITFSPGIAYQSYDATNSAVSFAFPAGATSRTFQITVPTTSTETNSATYYIASHNVDPSTCRQTSMPANCSVGAVLVPVPVKGSLVKGAQAGPACVVIAAPPSKGDTNTKYAYSVACSAGVTPNSMAIISTAPTQSTLTSAKAIAYAEGIVYGSAFGSYDASAGVARFTFPDGTTSHSFELVVPTASTVQSATYRITSGANKGDPTIAHKTAMVVPLVQFLCQFLPVQRPRIPTRRQALTPVKAILSSLRPPSD